MIPVPTELKSHLKGEVTSHCFAWLIRRSDTVVLGFTDHDLLCLWTVFYVNRSRD